MRKILFITATHGNEQDGVKVMQQLENELPKDEYNYDWIIGNEKAYQKVNPTELFKKENQKVFIQYRIPKDIGSI